MKSCFIEILEASNKIVDSRESIQRQEGQLEAIPAISLRMGMEMGRRESTEGTGKLEEGE